MLKVIVIADDLTGAADTGVLFVPVVDEMRLLTAAQFSAMVGTAALSGAAVCTDSRSMDGEAAGQVVATLGARLKTLGAGLVYKKIDSCLRGHVGIELLRLLHVCERRGALVAPAYPRLGRTTLNGTHYVLGVPVAQSEAGEDPVRPVTSSCLAENLAVGHEQPVGAVDISAVRGNEDALVKAIQAELDAGRRLIAMDAATDDDLAAIADTALKFFPDLILSGSAGLAQAIAARLTAAGGQVQGAAGEEPAGPDCGPSFSLPATGAILFVAGSASSVLRTQLEMLAQKHHMPMSILEARGVLNGVPEQEYKVLSAALAANNLIICMSPPALEQERLPSQALALALGRLASRLILDRPGALRGIFASGGDTAQAVLNSLGNPDIIIDCELAPGFIVSTIGSGPCAGLRFLTKSGSFGHPAMLADVYERLTRPGPAQTLARTAAK